MDRLFHGLNRSITSGLLNQGIRAKTILLMLFVHFLEVQVVHPFVSHIIDCELVRLNIFVELRLGLQCLLRVYVGGQLAALLILFLI